MPAVQMDSKSYYGKYATLGAVIDTTKPIMEKYGLSISQFATSKDGAVGVTTVLIHTSGEWMSSTITLPLVEEDRKTMAQIAGSVISSLRRYSWAAVLGLYSDEDVDGETPKSQSPQREARPPNSWPTRPWDAETLKRAMTMKVATYEGKRKEPSEKQLDYCRSSLGGLKLSDPDRHTITLYLFGVESTGDLTAAQCSALIDWIGAKEETDWEPSQDAKVEARAVIKAYQIEQGQTELQL